MIKHSCPRKPRNIEIAYEEHWKTWDLYTDKDIIEINYCCFCGIDLWKSLGIPMPTKATKGNGGM